MDLSLCMIVKDEEAVLARCLKSACDLVDEVVIADTGSSDATVDIAKSFGAKVIFHPWNDDFSAARNASFSAASGDYLFWLDADDVLPEESRARFPALRRRLRDEAPDVLFCLYQTGGLTFFRERFIKNCGHAVWRGRVHECIVPFGKRLRDPFTVVHGPSAKDRSWRNLRIYQTWAAEEKLSGRDLFYYGRELCDHRLFTEAEAVLSAMLRGEGWYVNKIEACKTLAVCREETGDLGGAAEALFKSFLYGEPRADVCCRLGRIFRKQGRTDEAVFWYEAALACKDHTAEGDFEHPSCRTVTPLLELVCLYHARGDTQKALEYHKKSEAAAPDHPSVKFNRTFFGE